MDISSSPNQRWLAKEFASSLEQTHRSTRHDVYGYVEFAKHLGETTGPEPDPDFRAALRHRLLHELIEDELLPRPDELAVRRDQRTRRKGGSHCFERAPREPWIAAASTVLVVCGGALGLGQESSQALPSDALYPVKRFFESGEMTIANSPSEQAHELMEQATERLDEAQQLVTIDEVHAQQAVPATLVDFTEATTEAGSLVIEYGQVPGDDAATLVSEFHAFSSAAKVALDEIAASADSEVATLIGQARATLAGIEEQLPVLDSVLNAAGNTPVASDAVHLLGMSSGQGDGTEVLGSAIDEASGASLPVVDEPDSGQVEAVVDAAVEKPVDAVVGTLEGTTATLEHTVSVVELATTDTVSMAVATVNSTAKTVNDTVKTVDRTVRQTVDTARQTIERTVETVDQTVRQTAATAQQTVEQTVQTVEQTADALEQTAGALQTASDDSSSDSDAEPTLADELLSGQLTS